MGATVSKLEWQEKSSRNSVEESVEYKRSYALISALVTESMSPEFKSSITTLRGTDAQSMIDFLNKVESGSDYIDAEFEWLSFSTGAQR
jgi:hypothetical protein